MKSFSALDASGNQYREETCGIGWQRKLLHLQSAVSFFGIIEQKKSAVPLSACSKNHGAVDEIRYQMADLFAIKNHIQLA